MNPKVKTSLWQFSVCLIPIVYFLVSWSDFSQSVPLHYGLDGPDRFGNKIELLMVIIFMVLVGFGSSLVIRYSDRLDPKYKTKTPGSMMLKISWTVCVFICILSIVIIYTTLSYSKSTTPLNPGKYIPLIICVMFIVMANFINSLKPSYFVGIRTPWTLTSEDNWRKTHHLGSRVMFIGGIIMTLAILLLPDNWTQAVFLPGIIIITLLPIIYSYNLYRTEKNEN